MKHVIATTLIATALASPLRANIVEIHCTPIDDLLKEDQIDFTLRIDVHNWSATLNRNELVYDLQTLVFDEQYVIWAEIHNYGTAPVSVHLINLERSSLRVQYVMSWFMDFRMTENDFGTNQTAFQCVNSI